MLKRRSRNHVLSRNPPIACELIYASHERGFALASMRGPLLSRYYIQAPLAERAGNWTDEAYWAELERRLPTEQAARLVTGPSLEKSVAQLRSQACEPMRWIRLFLCGGAAHIVPPAGAKGLNLAASYVHYLFEALRRFYRKGNRVGIEGYSATALARVWKAMRFS